MKDARGVVWVHSTPRVLCQQIEWAITRALGCEVRLDWMPQPLELRSQRAEYSWFGTVGTGAKLASQLMRCSRLRFEVTEERTCESDGMRWSFTPTLGVHATTIDSYGNAMICEERLRTALHIGKDLEKQLIWLLGQPWDDELEPFRTAGEDTTIRWIHKVG